MRKILSKFSIMIMISCLIVFTLSIAYGEGIVITISSPSDKDASPDVLDSQSPFIFSDATWNSTIEDVIALEGEIVEEYEATSNRYCYVFNKSFNNLDGIIRYFFSSDGLQQVTFVYDATDVDTVNSIYNVLKTSLTAEYGESGYNLKEENVSGDVWYFDKYSISINKITMFLMSIQYSYTLLNDDVSNEKPMDDVRELNFNANNEIPEYLSYSLKRIEASDKILPSNPTSYYTYYEAKTEGNVYLDIVLDVQNLQTISADVSDLLGVTITANGVEYTGFAVAEDEDGKNFDQYCSIAPLDNITIHLLTEIPSSEINSDIEVSVYGNGIAFNGSYNFSNVLSNREYLKVGAKITTKDVSEISIVSLEFASDLYPRNPTGYYSYYYAKSGKIFLMLTVDVKNKKATSLMIDNVAGVRAVYNGKYNYTSTTVFDDDDGKNLSSDSSIYSIEPLDSLRLYYLFELPQEAKGGQVELTISVAGEKYYMIIGK